MILDLLLSNKDEKYRDFHTKLVPNMKKEDIIGVRVPILRKIAKNLKNTKESKIFLINLPHKYNDENMLHALFINDIKDYDECINEINRFLPYVNNWAVCDILSPKIFKKNKDKLIIDIRKWIKSKEEYTCRFGIKMLMNFYLDDDFKEEYNELVKNIKSNYYYINMMIAWYFSFALIKKWDSTIKIIENKDLDKWVHNKTIQKSCESYRITRDRKDYLKSLNY